MLPPSETDPLLPTYTSLPPDLDPSLRTFTDYFLPDDFNSPVPGRESTTSSAGSPRFLGHGFNENLIPIYCSILAAVVVGLVAYIVFKRFDETLRGKTDAQHHAAVLGISNAGGGRSDVARRKDYLG